MQNNIIKLPHKFTPREYQLPLWKAFFVDGLLRFLTIWHRRAGKDATDFNLVVAAAMQRVGSYYYLFPQLKQARRDIWEAITSEGKTFLSAVPERLIAHKNNTEMTIKLINGSIIKFCGADRYDALMGSNPVGIVLSEYSLMNPKAWDYLRPILAENKGWALFQYTPRGMNHGLKLYESVSKNKDWFVQLLTVNDTRRHDGTPVISEKDIQTERDAGMSEEMIQQEFYCSFTSAVHGAYFAEQMRRAQEQDRIYDFPIDVSLPVHTYWDLGIFDPTSIWFVQMKRGEIICVNYYEFNNQEPQHYVTYLNDFRAKHGIAYGQHYAPHDVTRRDVTLTTTQDRYRMLGINMTRVPRIDKKISAINALRAILGRITFHKTNCKEGIACLLEYHSKYNEKFQTHGEPVHNWASHGVDALMQLAQSYRDGGMLKRGGVLLNRVNQGRL